MRNKKTLLFAAFILPKIVLLQAQNTQPDSLRQYFLQPVTISATRDERPAQKTPYAVSVIDSERLKQLKTGVSLEEALRTVPGLIVSNRQNLSLGDRISIRGIGSRASFGVRGVKVLLDGIPLTFADGQSQLNNVDLNALKKIEVLRGPASALYGNAAGGVILLQTAPLENSENAAVFEPKFTIGDFGLTQFSGNFKLRRAKKLLALSARRLSLDGFREHGNSFVKSINALAKIQLSEAWRLSGAAHYVDAPYLLNPSSLDKESAKNTPETARFFVRSQGAGKIVDQLNTGLTIERRGENGGRFQTTLFYIDRSLFNPIPGRVIDLRRDALGLRSIYTKRFERGGQSLLVKAGFDLESQKDERLEFANSGLPDGLYDTLAPEEIIRNVVLGEILQNQQETVLGVGIFAELEFSPNRFLSLTAGLRYDSFKFKSKNHPTSNTANSLSKISLDQPSPMLGAMWRPRPLFAFYANFSSAFQTPTTVELTNRPDREGGLNESLEPENVLGLEAGGKGIWQEKNIRYGAAFFTMRVRNMLIPFQIQSPGSEEIFYRNAGSARNRGVELDLSWRFRSVWRFSTALTLMDFRFQDYAVETESGLAQLRNKKLPGIPGHRFFAEAGYRNSAGLFGELSLESVGEYFANDFNGGGAENQKAFLNEAYVLMDLRTGFSQSIRKSRIEFFFGVNNIFNRRYNASIVPNAFRNRFFEPSPGRSWYSGLSAPIDF